MKAKTLSSPPKQLGWLVHAAAWAIILFFPFLFTGRHSEGVTWQGYLRFLIMLLGSMIVFYTNYCYLVKRYLFNKQIRQFLVNNLLLFSVLIILTHLGMEYLPDLPDAPQHRSDNSWKKQTLFVTFDLIKYFFVTALSVALKMTNSWYQMETERKELEKQRTEAELQNLKNQLNPHFLFNTLNNIYSLVATNTEKAQDAIHELSRMLRYILYESSHSEVPIKKDVEFVSNYIELMRIRMPENVCLETNIRIETPDTLIAPLLFISLIENAFKHGISTNKPSFIQVTIVAKKGAIHGLIRNSYFPKDEFDQSGSGIGLVNLKKRLELLYPQAYTLTCEQDGETYCSELNIQIPGTS